MMRRATAFSSLVARRTGFDDPAQVRVICRYPFAQPADGRLWVVEKHPGSLGKIYRIPELSLRLLYDLAEEAPEL
jgi:hypothetical protein